MFLDLMQLTGINPGSPLGAHVAQQVDDTPRSTSKPQNIADFIDSDAYDIKLDKSNILMLGPTGSGKTLLAQTIARCLGESINVEFSCSVSIQSWPWDSSNSKYQ